jgi:PPM family protein phosphatase
MVQLTEDHSVLARLQSVDHPLLSDPDIFVPRSMLYRSLGQEDEIGADTLDFTIAPGDRLLLCSDGLWDEVDSQEIAQALAGAIEPSACAERLVALANAAGGHDNSTAVVVFVRASMPDEAERIPEAGEDGEAGAVSAAPEREGSVEEQR